MSSTENKQAVQHAFDEIAHGNPEPLLNNLADDVQWTIIGDTKFSGLYDGKQAVIDRLLTPLGEVLEGHLEITVDNMLADGHYVVVQGRGEAKTKSGGTYNNVYCWVYRFDGGKIVELTEYLDTEVVTASFGR